MATTDWDVEYLVSAFRSVFNVQPRPFGRSRARWQGVSDDARGVQWNAGVDRDEGTIWLGVNLEGMEYDGWPVARLIERELRRPVLLSLASSDAPHVRLEWSRDAWQASARPPIREREIGGGPVALRGLTADLWRRMLLEAYDCLDAERGHRGRGTQWVTLPSKGPVERTVSPHLHMSTVAWTTTPRSQPEAERMISECQVWLMKLHEWAVERSSR